MLDKFLVCHVLLVIASCELWNQDIGYQEYASRYDDYQPHDYNFNYAVSDPHTGDHKSQWEVKENGVVRGAYSLLEPDGTTRIVEYIADHDGFRAVVKKLGVAVHPAPVVVPAPVVPEISQWKAYNGRVDNYTPLIAQPPANLQVVGPYGQYAYEASYGAVPSIQTYQELPRELVGSVPSLVGPYQESPRELVPQVPSLVERYQESPRELVQPVPSFVERYQELPIASQRIEPQSVPRVETYHAQIPQPQVPEVPGLEPIGPSYQTNIVYGLTGNTEDDSRYTNEYPSSDRYRKAVPIAKRENPEKEKFVIVYPEPEAH